MQRFVGFYWTLQAPWAGLVALSEDVDRAVLQSRTIAYQRALAKRFVQDEKGELIGEVACMELSADRGTEHGADAVRKAAAQAATRDATLLWVDFAEIGWRDHSPLRRAIAQLDASGQRTLPLLPYELPGFTFRSNDPLTPPAGNVAEHFASWKASTASHRAKRDRLIAEELREALQAFPERYGRNTRIADRLNERGVPTKTEGPKRRWSGDLVRKAIQTLEAKDVAARD